MKYFRFIICLTLFVCLSMAEKNNSEETPKNKIHLFEYQDREEFLNLILVTPRYRLAETHAFKVGGTS